MGGLILLTSAKYFPHLLTTKDACKGVKCRKVTARLAHEEHQTYFHHNPDIEGVKEIIICNVKVMDCN